MTVTINGSTGITTNGITDTTGTDALNNVTVAGTLAVTGTSTLTGAVTQTGSSTATSFIPTGSTVPANGMYLSAANTLNLATNTTNQVSISSGGIVTGTAGNLMLVQGTAQASTSGTSITFSSIPSWVKRITVMFNGISTNGTSNIQIQIGSGSVVTTGYSSSYSQFGGSNQTSGSNTTTGFGLVVNGAATQTYSGVATISNISGNNWVYSSLLNTNGTTFLDAGAGNSTALSGTLDRVVITTVNGTDTFDAGTINILYE